MDRSKAPLANIVTLGVRDFNAQREFCRRLGWRAAFDSDEFVVFELRGALLALFPRELLAADARVAPQPPAHGIDFSVIINVSSAEQVDETVRAFRQAGATVTKEPVDAEFFEGRSSYVADPEGNYWEIVWAAEGNSVLDAARRAAGLAR